MAEATPDVNTPTSTTSTTPNSAEVNTAVEQTTDSGSSQDRLGIGRWSLIAGFVAVRAAAGLSAFGGLTGAVFQSNNIKAYQAHMSSPTLTELGLNNGPSFIRDMMGYVFTAETSAQATLRLGVLTTAFALGAKTWYHLGNDGSHHRPLD